MNTVSSGTAPTGATTFETVNPPVNSVNVFVAVTATDTVAVGNRERRRRAEHHRLPHMIGVRRLRRVSVRVHTDPNVIPETTWAGPATLVDHVSVSGARRPIQHTNTCP